VDGNSHTLPQKAQPARHIQAADNIDNLKPYAETVQAGESVPEWFEKQFPERTPEERAAAWANIVGNRPRVAEGNLRYAREHGVEVTPEGKLVLYHGTQSGPEIVQSGYLKANSYLAVDPEVAKRFGFAAGSRRHVQVIRVEVDPSKGFLHGDGYFSANEPIELTGAEEVKTAAGAVKVAERLNESTLSLWSIKWAIWNDKVLFNQNCEPHVNWFDRLGIPSSGKAFDKIPRGRLKVSSREQEAVIFTDAGASFELAGALDFEFDAQSFVAAAKRHFPQLRNYRFRDELSPEIYGYKTAGKVPKASETQRKMLEAMVAGNGTIWRVKGGFWVTKEPLGFRPDGLPMYAEGQSSCGVQTVRALEKAGLVIRTNAFPEEWRDTRRITDAGRNALNLSATALSLRATDPERDTIDPKKVTAGTEASPQSVPAMHGWSYDGYFPDRHNDFFENVENPHTDRGDEPTVLETGAVVPEEPLKPARGEMGQDNPLVRPTASKTVAQRPIRHHGSGSKDWKESSRKPIIINQNGWLTAKGKFIPVPENIPHLKGGEAEIRVICYPPMVEFDIQADSPQAREVVKDALRDNPTLREVTIEIEGEEFEERLNPEEAEALLNSYRWNPMVKPGLKSAAMRGIWYHGTSVEKGEQALKDGWLRPGMPSKYKEVDIPRNDAVYVTRWPLIAQDYGYSRGHVKGVVLEVEPDPESLLPDEDSIHSALQWGTLGRTGDASIVERIRELWLKYWNDNAEGNAKDFQEAWRQFEGGTEEAPAEVGEWMKSLAEHIRRHEPGLSKQIVDSVGLAAHLGPVKVRGIYKEASAKFAAQRGVWFHGSSIRNLESILHQGLIPELPDPSKRNWATDPEVSYYTPSRESYGGIYVTRNLLTATSSPKDHNVEGREVVVCMELQPSTFYMDEDNVVSMLQQPIGTASDIEYHVLPAYLAIAYPDKAKGWEEYIQQSKDKYANKVVKYVREKYHEASLHPGMEERIRELAPACFAASLARIAAHMAARTDEWRVRGAWARAFAPNAGDTAPEADEVRKLFPASEEGERMFREEAEKFTKALRKYARPEDPMENWSRDTARVTTPIGYSGSNRITAVVECRDGRKYRSDAEGHWDMKIPARLIVHWGILPSEFFQQWKARIGDDYVVGRAAEPGKAASVKAQGMRKMAAGTWQEAERIVKSIDPESQLLLFHSGTADEDASINDAGVLAQMGEWVEEVLWGATDSKETIQNIKGMGGAAYFSDTPGWIRAKVRRVVKREPTFEDIRKHGQLTIVVADLDGPINRFIGEGHQGQEYETLRGEKWVSNELPFGLEPGDFFSTEDIDAAITLVGDDLIKFMERNYPTEGFFLRDKDYRLRKDRGKAAAEHTPEMATEIMVALQKEFPAATFRTVGSVGRGETSQHDLDIFVEDANEENPLGFEGEKAQAFFGKLGFEWMDQSADTWVFYNRQTKQVIDLWWEEPEPGYLVKEASFEKVALNIPKLVQDFGKKLLERYKVDFGHDYPDEKFPVKPEEIIESFFGFDPTANHEYVAWITGNYARGELGRYHDIEEHVVPLLKRYHELKKTRHLRQEDANIQKVHGVSGLEGLLAKYADVEAESRRQKALIVEQRFYRNGEAELMHNDADMKIVIPRTKEASCFFGMNTKWCTAGTSNNAFSSYEEKGPLYIVLLKKENARFQFHFQTGQFTDERDEPLDVVDWLEEHPKVAEIFYPIANQAEARCEDCEGQGSTTCDNCDGEDNVECGNCESSGRETCDTCGGKGNVPCGDCDGYGVVEEKTCETCGGDGTQPCPNECTDGYVTCGNCDGVGSTTCDRCEEGSVECDTCGGTGESGNLASFQSGCHMALGKPLGAPRRPPAAQRAPAAPAGAPEQPPVRPMEEYQANLPHPLDPLALQSLRQASKASDEPYVESHRKGPVVWVDWFEVPPKLRGKGLGRKVYMEWEAKLPKSIRLVRLFAGNVGGMPAEGFWEKMGFGYVFEEEGNQLDSYMWKGVNGSRTPPPLPAPDDGYDGSCYDIMDEPENLGKVAKLAKLPKRPGLVGPTTEKVAGQENLQEKLPVFSFKTESMEASGGGTGALPIGREQTG
jgi:GNAT superfamily N-acetyltransferase